MRWLDTIIRPDVRAFGRSWSAFRLLGYAGLLLAVALAMGLVAAGGLSPAVMAAVVATAVATFFAVALLTKVVTGTETLTYYHHQTAVLGTASLLLWAAGQPVLRYLDATILGVGVFVACGRLGCLMVGCCHGRPVARGVRYRGEHVAAGFPACLVGVRLLPVQGLEALWLLCIVVVGAVLVLAGSAPGTALEWYVVSYATARFFLEFVRGDAGRAHLLGFSEAQWTSVALAAAVVAGGAAGVLPPRPWCAAATAGLAGAMAVVAVRRRLAAVPRHRLLHPRHVQEIATALSAPAGPGAPDVRTTSQGVRLSSGEVPTPEGLTSLYALSSATREMDAATARVLAELIVRLRHPGSGHDLVPGHHGVFHVLVPPRFPAPAPATADQSARL